MQNVENACDIIDSRQMRVVIVWDHVKMHGSHYGCLRTLSKRGHVFSTAESVIPPEAVLTTGHELVKRVRLPSTLKIPASSEY